MHVVSRISKTASRGLRAFFKESSKLGSSWGQNGVNLKKLRQSILTLQSKRTAQACGSNCGGTPGVRTLDPLIKSQMLCQLS